MSLLLIGEFELAIDAKNRLSIPAALRESIHPDRDGTNFVLILGANRHLCLYPDQYYRRLLAKMKSDPARLVLGRRIRLSAVRKGAIAMRARWRARRFGNGAR